MTAIASLALLSAACGDDAGDEDDAAAPDAGTVVMELVAFKPATVSIDAGATVTWRQNDPGAHTVTSGTVDQGSSGVTQQPDDRFDSGELPKGETFEFTPSEAGTYPYFCRLHPATMRGEIHVR